MSILIKGMKMPHSCRECPFERSCVLRVLVDRHPDCPIVPVPAPHGRLVDAEVLWDELRYGHDVDLRELPETLAALLEMIDHQDTIIEAEEGRQE